MLTGDEAVAYFHLNGSLQGIICIHVYDCHGAGTFLFFANLFNQFANAFDIIKRELNKFRCTGNQSMSIEISQEAYRKMLEEKTWTE